MCRGHGGAWRTEIAARPLHRRGESSQQVAVGVEDVRRARFSTHFEVLLVIVVVGGVGEISAGTLSMNGGSTDDDSVSINADRTACLGRNADTSAARNAVKQVDAHLRCCAGVQNHGHACPRACPLLRGGAGKARTKANSRKPIGGPERHELLSIRVVQVRGTHPEIQHVISPFGAAPLRSIGRADNNRIAVPGKTLA